MDSKLTLNIDKGLTKKAKTYARERGRSLSDLVESYFKLLTDSTSAAPGELTPAVKSLLGSFNVPGDFDYKKELSGQLTKKYL